MVKLNVVVACEYSGRMREAFRALGHNAVSVDFLDAEDGSSHHYKGDIKDYLDINSRVDLLVAHPPCTHLASSGGRWLKDHEVKSKKGNWWHAGASKRAAQIEAVAFVKWLSEVDAPFIAIENPIGNLSSLWRKPDAIVQPWWFGDEAFKATCWWLKGLPALVATNKLTPPTRGTEEHKSWQKCFREPPGPNQWKNRSRTYQGMADAAASQWSSAILSRLELPPDTRGT